MSVLRRIFGGVNKRLSPADLEFVDSYLDDVGKFLFFQMAPIDQRHCVAVGREIIIEAGYQKNLNMIVLIKAALLHDIGKVEGEFNLVSRIAVAVIRRMMPSFREKWGIGFRGRGFKIRYGLYVDRIHPDRGAYMAQIFGMEEAVVELIRKHHDPPYVGQSDPLTWLQLADNRH